MSLRLEMLQIARLAPEILGDSAALVEQFLRQQQHPDGSFRNRRGASDLYYTVFGLEGLMALRAQVDWKAVRTYLEQFGAGDDLDFVHLCCLARCWALARTGGQAIGDEPRRLLIEHLERHRSTDGGFHPRAAQPVGTVYAAFLAVGALQDLQAQPADLASLVSALESLRRPDFAWANERAVPAGSTNATAAAVTLLRQCHRPVDAATADWLLARVHPQGGFAAAAGAPLPDLLSTATALHALAAMERDFSSIRETCLDFIDSLWTNEGGFHGHWADDALDCEYTYYGLLALGHLAV